jgi:hypothetical protein
MGQADELLHRQGLLEKLGNDYQEQEDVMLYLRARDDNCKLDLLSDAEATSMVSGFTTASRSTIVAGNNKIDARRKYSKQVRKSRPGGLTTVTESDYEADHEYEKTPPREKLQFKQEDGKGAIAVGRSPPGLLGKLVSNQQPEIDAKRHRYTSVLRLKMKARLGQFYSQRYLPMFPEGLRPAGVITRKNKGGVPDLASESSSGSSDSSEDSHFIDYGALPPLRGVKCSISNESFLDLAVTGSLGLIPRHGQTFREHQRTTQQYISVMTSSNLKSPDHYIVLINRRSHFPLAVCALKAGSGPPVIRIYATRRRVFGQRPAATTKQLGLEWAVDLPLFTWAEMVTDGNSPEQMKFSIFMANGSDGHFSTHPSYEANFDGDLDEPVIKMIGQTDMERASSGCALISIRVDGDSLHKDVAGMSFHIDLARGIDPALMICFTAIADEVIEKSMRQQCKERIQHRIRKASYSLSQKFNAHRGG